MTIKEVCEKYDITADTLRYYERVGVIPTVTRTAGGIRDYQESDIGWVENAICFRDAGMPVEMLIEYVRLFQEGDSTIDARAALLKEARERFDMVIVDTPPLNLVTDAELICPLVDYSLFVLHYGRHSMEEIRETVERVKRYSDKPAAIVMNHCEREPGHYGYGYYGKGYYGKNA